MKSSSSSQLTDNSDTAQSTVKQEFQQRTNSRSDVGFLTPKPPCCGPCSGPCCGSFLSDWFAPPRPSEVAPRPPRPAALPPRPGVPPGASPRPAELAAPRPLFGLNRWRPRSAASAPPLQDGSHTIMVDEQ